MEIIIKIIILASFLVGFIGYLLLKKVKEEEEVINYH